MLFRSEIEKQTDFTFFYNNKQVDLKRKVTLNVKNENVFSVLKKLFSGTNTTYKVLDKNIILSEKSAISSATKEVAIVQQVGRSGKGVVVDDKGEPVIGATVMVKGSTNGTITDFDGKDVYKRQVLFLVGNSTMRTGTLGNGNNGQWGWGYFEHEYFDEIR